MNGVPFSCAWIRGLFFADDVLAWLLPKNRRIACFILLTPKCHGSSNHEGFETFRGLKKTRVGQSRKIRPGASEGALSKESCISIILNS
jgi:hypothetical protein